MDSWTDFLSKNVKKFNVHVTTTSCIPQQSDDSMHDSTLLSLANYFCYNQFDRFRTQIV